MDIIQIQVTRTGSNLLLNGLCSSFLQRLRKPGAVD
jgi:hypothetical protein